MNKPPFDPNQPFQAVDKPPFDPNQPFQASDAAPQPQQNYSTRNMIGDVARPLLEGGAAVAGGVIGAPLGPVGAVGGGALGFGVGKAAADLLDRGLGRKPFLQSIPQAIKETGSNALAGAEAEATGLAASKVIPPLLKGAGNLRNKLGEWATGIDNKDFQSVAKVPMSMRPGVMEKAGDNFSEAMGNAGISSELTPEAVDRLRSPGKYAFDTFNKLKTAGSITPQEALNARQSIDAVYPIPNKKNGNYIRMLDEIRDSFQQVISNASPELQSASKDYAVAKSAQRFKSIFPQTNAGKPNYFRSGAILAGLAAGHPGAILGVPAVAGTVTAATGSAGSLTNSILRNPTSRRVASSILGNKLFDSKPMSESGVVNNPNTPPTALNNGANDGNPNQGIENVPNESGNHPESIPPVQPLTKQKAREFLDQANGKKDLARKLAKKAGYSW